MIPTIPAPTRPSTPQDNIPPADGDSNSRSNEENNNTRAFHTAVYRKPTNMGMCLNGLSECPRRYKQTIISAYIRRALSHCSSWKTTVDEIEHAAQVLVDNGYSNSQIEKVVKNVMDKWYNNENNVREDCIKVFYKNQYHNNYKEDEKAIRKILEDNVRVTADNVKLNLIIYYSNKKSVNLIMKNNPRGVVDKLRRRSVVYHFKCPIQGCTSEYIGMSTTSLFKRISCHAQEGNIFSHFNICHNSRPSRATLIDAIDVIDCDADPRRL